MDITNRLRPAYDKLYIRVETYLLALDACRQGRKGAAAMAKNPLVQQQYPSTIRSYWKQFKVAAPKKFWFQLYCNEQRPFSPQYIPDDLWYHRIVPHYNNLIFAKALQDKCLHSVLFGDMKRPTTVVKNIAGVFYDDALNLLTAQQAADRCRNVGRVIVKPSVGSGQGHGIRFYDTDQMTPADAEEIFRQYGQNFIIQEKLLQHETLAQLNPRSVNTIRVITFLHKDKVHVLTAILRVGSTANEVDNTSQGGYKATIGSDGRLSKTGTTTRNGRVEYVQTYPNGIRFEDVVIPSYDKILDTVCTHAAKMSHFKLIGWDIAVDTQGEPVLVEFNVIPAQGHATNGPLFGELTDEVLTEVFGKRSRKE